jgi:hypothetical protein
MDLVPIDASWPLAEQIPFHLLIHKLYGDNWRAQLEAFAAHHLTVLIVDRLDLLFAELDSKKKGARQQGLG